MSDLHDAPAVPPEDHGGDDRIGLSIAGGILVVLGWGIALALNLVLHSMAPSAGYVVGPSIITTHIGTYAWATAAFGAVTGAVGAVMIYLARQSPSGPFVLPGTSY